MSGLTEVPKMKKGSYSSIHGWSLRTKEQLAVSV